MRDVSEIPPLCIFNSNPEPLVNSKFEILNSKQIQNFKLFEFMICLGFRA